MILPNKNIDKALKEIKRRVLAEEQSLIECDILIFSPPFSDKNRVVKQGKFTINIIFDTERFDDAYLMVRWIVRWEKNEEGKREKHKIVNLWMESEHLPKVDPVNAQINLLKKTKLTNSRPEWALIARLYDEQNV